MDMKTAIFLLACVGFGAAKDNITCSTCGEEDFLLCNATQVETCDGKCAKWSVDVDITDSVSGSAFRRSCMGTCVDANIVGQGLHCCDDADLCNAATTTSPFIAVTMAASALVVALAFRRQ